MTAGAGNGQARRRSACRDGPGVEGAGDLGFVVFAEGRGVGADPVDGGFVHRDDAACAVGEGFAVRADFGALDFVGEEELGLAPGFVCVALPVADGGDEGFAGVACRPGEGPCGLVVWSSEPIDRGRGHDLSARHHVAYRLCGGVALR